MQSNSSAINIEQFSEKRIQIEKRSLGMSKEELFMAIGELEVELFKLSVPLIQQVKLQTSNFKTDSSKGNDFQLREIFREILRLRTEAVNQAVSTYKQYAHLAEVVEEYAAYRRFTSQHRNPLRYSILDLNNPYEIVAHDMELGTGSGARLILRLIEVFPYVVSRYSFTPDQELLRQCLTRSLPHGIARTRSWWQLAFDRIASGCAPTCFNSSQDVVRAKSPHAEWLSQYDDLRTFREFHWLDVWFDPTNSQSTELINRMRS